MAAVSKEAIGFLEQMIASTEGTIVRTEREAAELERLADEKRVEAGHHRGVLQDFRILLEMAKK